MSQTERIQKELKGKETANLSPNQSANISNFQQNFNYLKGDLQQQKFINNFRPNEYRSESNQMNDRYLSRKHRRSDASNDFQNEKTNSNNNNFKANNNNNLFNNNFSNKAGDDFEYKKKNFYNQNSNFNNSGEFNKNSYNNNNYQIEEKNFTQNKSYNKYNQNFNPNDKYNKNFNKLGKLNMFY